MSRGVILWQIRSLNWTCSVTSWSRPGYRQLIRDEKLFTAAYEGSVPGTEEFDAILQRLHLVPQCRLVWEWCSRKFIFLCLELCGPPSQSTKPDPTRTGDRHRPHHRP